MKRSVMEAHLIERLGFEFGSKLGVDPIKVAEIMLDSIEGKGMKPPKRHKQMSYGMEFVHEWDDEVKDIEVVDMPVYEVNEEYEAWLYAHGSKAMREAL